MRSDQTFCLLNQLIWSINSASVSKSNLDSLLKTSHRKTVTRQTRKWILVTCPVSKVRFLIHHPESSLEDGLIILHQIRNKSSHDDHLISSGNQTPSYRLIPCMFISSRQNTHALLNLRLQNPPFFPKQICEQLAKTRRVVHDLCVAISPPPKELANGWVPSFEFKWIFLCVEMSN